MWANRGLMRGVLEAVFLLLLVTYGLKFSELVAFDVVLFAWGVIGVFSFFWVRGRVFVVAGTFYLVMLFAYLLGSFFVSGYQAGGDFVKNIGSHFFLTVILLQTLQLPSAPPANSWIEKYFIVFSKIGVGLVLYWALFIFNGAQYGGESLVAEYGGANYLTMADLLAFFTLAMMASGSFSRVWIVSIFLISTVAMTFLGSRAALVVFLLSSVFFVEGRFSFWKKLLISVSALAVVFAIGILALEFLDPSLLYRFETLFDMSQDESKRARSAYVEVFMMRLEANPGCYLYPCMPHAGEYVHNIVSVHEYFGLIGSVLTLVLFVNMGFALARGYSPRLKSVLVYSLVLLLIARAWVAIVFPVVVAYLLDAAMFNYLRLKSTRLL